VAAPRTPSRLNPLYWLLNAAGLLKVVLQRQRSNLGLTAARIAGFVVAVALVVSIPIYADAVAYRILRTELSPNEDEPSRPPYTYMFMRTGSSGEAFTGAEYQRADAYFSGPAASDLGLPPRVSVRYAATDKLRLLYPAGSEAAKRTGDAEQLTWVGVGFADRITGQVEFVEGAAPKPVLDGGPAQVMIHERMADTLGLQVGEQYRVLSKEHTLEVPVVVSGVWRAKDSADPYWFVRPESLQDDLLLPEETFEARVLTQGEKAPYEALWYLVLNGDQARSRDVPELNARITDTLQHGGSLLPGLTLAISPQEALQDQYDQVRLLTLTLTIFSIPLLGLVGYFIIMVTGMVIQRQQNEIAVLRSRGVSYTEVLGIYLIEGLVIGLFSIVIGLALGLYSATLISWTRSFLLFVPRSDVPVEISPEAVRNGMWVIALTLVASLIPALGAAGHTIISYKQERARMVRRPIWQRMYLDVLLLVAGYYGYRQLRDRGTISFLGRDAPTDDPFSNPLLILTPALCILALALFSVRLFPLLMGVLGYVTNRLSGVSSLLALRYLTRTPRAYTSPVLLLILTLSLATFTASMARTLDSHLDDTVYYEVGADMRLADLGQSTEGASNSPFGGGSAPTDEEDPLLGEDQAAPAQAAEIEPQWLFLPVTDYLGIQGVEHAARVTRSEAQVQAGDQSQNATVLGLDRMDFPDVAHWRRDYAPASLGALMNALAVRENGVLVSGSYLRANGLAVGSPLNISMSDVSEQQGVPFVVVGEVNYFPSVYPEDGPFFIANLEYLFSRQGGEFPYEVWLDTAPGTTKAQVENGIVTIGLRSIVSDEAPITILTALERPERQGVYGLLSLGFVASALLTGLGFLFYAIVSFQRRYIELGMLRAIGLSVRQMAVLLVWEQSLIIGIGVAAGTAIGVIVSNVFIPFLQVRGGAHPQTPTFQVLIAWQQIQVIYLVFAVLLGAALLAVTVQLLRMRIFQAVKLGEAT